MNFPTTHRRSMIQKGRSASRATVGALALVAAIAASGCDTALAPRNNGSAAAGLAAPASEDAAGAVREIEEADILKIIDNTVYVLNRFRGLIIIDASDPDQPSIVGKLEFTGRPVEMFVVGPRAYVISSGDPFGPEPLRFGGAESSIAPPPPSASKVAVIDVSDPAAPALLGDIQLVGRATASRRVGDVIYVVGRDIAPQPPVTDDSAAPTTFVDRGFVASINVADPENILAVDRETFDGGVENMHVSTQAIFAAGTDYDVDADQAVTLVQYVDISDPAGDIQPRGTAAVPGFIRNRFFMDDFDGVLRVVTDSFGFGFRTARLFTLDISDPDAIAPLGEVQIIQNETVEAVRFDGPRGYVVTFLRVDPLFVLDLSDPANPAVTGQLEVPGFSTHIEPRGDKLIAVGIDDTQGRRPAVALYDVSDPAAPSQLSRIILGPPNANTQSQAVFDEKAFKIIDELGLIAIPFNYVDYEPVVMVDDDGSTAQSILADDSYVEPTCVSAVQLIDFLGDELVQRGWFDHRGPVQRVGVLGLRAFALSQLGFQTIDIDDRDDPHSMAFLPFFDEDRMREFNRCGGFVGPPDVPFFPFFGGPIIIQLMLDGAFGENEMCGTISIMPMMMLAGLAGFMRPARQPKHRRRV
ncbi:MAG: beta-propeller domain-containing protein [Phycisphaerae bacterium]